MSASTTPAQLQELLTNASSTSSLLLPDHLKTLRTVLIQKTPNPTISALPTSTSFDLFTAVLRTAEEPSITHLHRAIACDTLSAWLIRSKEVPALIPPVAESRGLEVWIRLAQLVLSHFEDATAPIAKALKDLLTNVIAATGANTPRGQEILKWIATTSMEGVEAKEGKKGGYYCLDIALRRGLSATWALETYKQTRATNETKNLEGEPLIRDLLVNLEDRNLCPAIGKAFTTLVTSLKKDLEQEEWMKTWASPMTDVLMEEEARQRAQIYVLPGIFKANPTTFTSYIMKLGFVAKGEARQAPPSEAGIGALLCCLKVGKDCALVADVGESEDDTAKSKHPKIPIEPRFISPLLAHLQSDIRIAALNLLTYNPANTRSFTPEAFELLRGALPAFHNETDPEVRDNVIGAMRNIVERLASSSYVCDKEAKQREAQAQKSDDPAKLLERAKYLRLSLRHTQEFCVWYINFLSTLLRPGRSYQRNSSGLRALLVMVRSGVDDSLVEYAMKTARGRGSLNSAGKTVQKGQFQWADFSKDFRIFGTELKDLLLQALFNPYDDIRSLAGEILRYDPKWTSESLETIVDAGMEAMNTSGRARDSDGLARTLSLVCEVSARSGVQLKHLWKYPVLQSGDGLDVLDWILDVLEKEYLKIVAEDFAIAVKERPIHGIFSAINYVLQTPHIYEQHSTDRWKKIHGRIFDTCTEIWRITKEPLCADAPEGFVPEDIDEEEDEDSSSQTLLSYSWRAIKESSALLGTVARLAPYDPKSEGKSTVSTKDFEFIGSLLLAQLSDIRHRGAFSAVSPSFVALCSRCFRSSDVGLKALPKMYLERNLSQIMEKSNVITRRSGGLPYLIVGILAAENDKSAPLLKSTFDHLMEIAKLPAESKKDGEKMDLPQVHASNCIRQIFIDSRMSTSAVPYTGPALSLAVSCFGSEIWAIRNCGVMLFTVLINRLFGTRRSRNNYTFTASSFTTKTFFERYPLAKSVLLQNLKDKVPDLENDSGAVEMVYPALSLLGRLDAAPGYDMEEFRPLVQRCMNSRIWKVRDVSARAFTSLVQASECVDTIEKLMSIELDDQNKVHGNLCAIRALLERRVCQAVLESKDGHDIWNRVFNIFLHNFNLFLANTNSITKSLYLQIIIPHLPTILKSPSLSDFRQALTSHLSPPSALISIVNESSFVGHTELKEHLATVALTLNPGAITTLLSTTDDEITLYATQHLISLPTPPSLPVATISTLWNIALNPTNWLYLRSASLSLLSRLPITPNSPHHYPSILSIASNPPTSLLYTASLPLLGSLTTPAKIHQTLPIIKSAAHEDQPFTTRAASLDALQNLLINLAATPTDALIHAFILLHDACLDDDFELRVRAARLVSRVIPDHDRNIAVVPTVAAQRVLDHLLTFAGFAGETLAHAVVEKVWGKQEGANEEWVRVMKEVKGVDGVLFAREKGNLFVDSVDVVRGFGGVLERCGVRGERGWVEGWVREAERGEEEWRKMGGRRVGAELEEVGVFLEKVKLGRRVCRLE